MSGNDRKNREREDKRDSKELKICPRCGLPYSYIEEREVGSNVYHYAVHVNYVDGKRRVKKCYLGPVSYIYVSSINDMILHGLIVPERAINYLREVIKLLKQALNQGKLKIEHVNDLIQAERELQELILELVLHVCGK